MATLTIRNVDPALEERLRLRADEYALRADSQRCGGLCTAEVDRSAARRCPRTQRAGCVEHRCLCARDRRDAVDADTCPRRAGDAQDIDVRFDVSFLIGIVDRVVGRRRRDADLAFQ